MPPSPSIRMIQFIDYDQSFISYKIAIRNYIVSDDEILLKC